MDSLETLRQVTKALKLAHQHLEWSSYGDNWERECARDSGLPEVIENAIADGERCLGHEVAI